jgi:hypothetical protein
VQELQKEYKNLELLLQGTQRENERCMAELERCAVFFVFSWFCPFFTSSALCSAKAREKMLERELSKLAGDNWQVSGVLLSRATVAYIDMVQSSLDITLNSSTATTQFGRSALGVSALLRPASSDVQPSQQSVEATMAHVEQVRLMILGMEQRLQVREEKLVKTVEKAEKEGARFQEIGKGLGLAAATV